MGQRLSATTALAALLIFLAGCGEKPEPPTTGPVVPVTTKPGEPKSSTTTSTVTEGKKGGEPAEALARKAIESFLTAGSPAVCEQFATARFVRRAYGDLKSCEAAQRPASAASSVEITSLMVRGGSASATAVPRGGTNGGEKLRIELTGQGDSWMIDSLKSNAPVGP